MKLKKLPLFYKIYFSLLIVFIIILIIFSMYLSGYLKDYNEGIHETVSKKFFDETFTNLNTDKIIEMSGIAAGEFETENDIREFVEKQLGGKLSYTSISTQGDNKDIKTYIVKSGDYKLATFTLDCDENNDYFSKSLTLHLPKGNKHRYRVFSGTTLMLNGKPVSDRYITGREPHKNAEFLPEGVTFPEWITYEVSGLTKEPEVSVVDRNGNATKMVEKDGVLCEELIYDESEPELVQRLLTAAKQYAACMQNDVSKYSVLPYFEKGTEIYENIRTVENTFVWDHAGYAIEDEQVSEFIRYDENTVSARISFTHILKMYGKEDYRDITDITYFARNVNGTYLIFARYNNI